jgi:flagellar M-ring protein FliF
MSSTASAAAQAASERLLTDQGADTPALAGPGGALVPSELGDIEDELEELIDIDRVEGRLKASSLKKISEIVDKHPDEALSIVRGWMYQET